MFADVPAELNKPFSQFPSDFNQLPTVSFVIPNLQHDMHSASIRKADHWLESNIKDYAKWATAHNSLLIVTWDEGSQLNHIPTIFFGAGVRRGAVDLPANHFRLLRTIEGMYDLPLLGKAANHTPLRKLFTAGTTTTSAQQVRPMEVPRATPLFSTTQIAGSTWSVLSMFMHNDGDDLQPVIESRAAPPDNRGFR